MTCAEYAERFERAHRAMLASPAAILLTTDVGARLIESTVAGTWMTEQLTAAGVSGTRRREIAVAFGRACFPNHDPWKVATNILAKETAEKDR